VSVPARIAASPRNLGAGPGRSTPAWSVCGSAPQPRAGRWLLSGAALASAGLLCR